MAYVRTYDKQMPFVGTTKQYDLLRAEARKRRVSIAYIIREMVNARYDLTRDTESYGVEADTGEGDTSE
jgi:hypothetical protein